MQASEVRKLLERAKGFDWDKGNIDKNWKKHKIDFRECEEVFFNHSLLVNFNQEHFQEEKRSQALGKTDRGRKLFVVFVLREKKIRVVSARDQSKKERKYYEQA